MPTLDFLTFSRGKDSGPPFTPKHKRGGFPGSRIGTRAARRSSRRRRGNPNLTTGFTLFEVLVVVGVISVLATVLLGYSRESSKRILLVSTEAKVVNLISRAKFLSIQTFFEDPGGGDDIICAHGVKLADDGGRAFIFRVIEDRVDGCPGSDELHLYGYSKSDTQELSGELSVINFDEDDIFIAASNSFEDIIFIPPDPLVVINSSEGVGQATLAITDGDLERQIVVTNAGRISVE